LQTFDELLLVVVEIFNKTLESLNLLAQRLCLLSFLTELLLTDLKVSALFLALTLETCNLLLQVIDLDVLLISLVLNLNGRSLSRMNFLVK